MNVCTPWEGTILSNGYGQLRANGRRYLAHRWAWEQANGPIPDGMMVCHRCDNPPCVNVDHLFLGSTEDNAKDMVAKGRQANQWKGATHCKRGHPFDQENTYYTKKGTRGCRTCRLMRQRAFTARKKVAH